MSGKVAKRLRKELKPELSSHVIGAHNIDEVISSITKRKVAPQFIIIDLFCGAGGTSTGFEMAGDMALVIACVNHDYKAIKSHWLNHSHVAHFEEDMRKLDLKPLIKLVEYYKGLYQEAYVILWASLECTNFSKAKGGQPRDADSRTLADHLDRYVIALQPDYVQIENVVEFMSWGPLDENGKPISKKNGQDFMRWRENMCNHGYQDEWRELNSANYGAYTSRNRLFGIFARPGMPIAWPEPTHAKVKKESKVTSLFDNNGRLPWRPVKDVLDFSDEGESIFTRAKPLSDKTLERIYAGLFKYVAKGDTSFISKYYSGKPASKVNSVNQPSATVTTFGNQSLVQTVGFTAQSVDQPAGTITTVDHHSLVQSVEQPAGTIVTNDKHRLVKCQPFLMPTNFDNKPVSIEQPAPTITANRKHHYLVNPSHGGHCTSTDQPCPVIIARQDKAPLYVVQAESGPVAVAVYEGDTEIMIRIKQFMAVYGIVDIKMRMLRVKELLSIQGFPEGYKLEGNQADQKKFIGNSVVPLVVKKWTEALGSRLIETYNQKIA